MFDQNDGKNLTIVQQTMGKGAWFMVRVTICGMCKNCMGLSENKCKTLCKAFPNGVEIIASTIKECAPGYHFEPIDDAKELCSKEVFIRKFA